MILIPPLCDFGFPQLVRSLPDEEAWRNCEDLVGDLDSDLRLLSAVTGCELTHEELTLPEMTRYRRSHEHRALTVSRRRS